jgi:uncharacterized protein with GYD domain
MYLHINHFAISYLVYLTQYICIYINIYSSLTSIYDNINSSLSIYLLQLSHYILLINWTEQGISKIKESSDRFSSFKASVEKAGGKLIGGYYTFGEYDVVIIIEAPNDEAVMSLMLKVGSAGNVRTKTLKAFSAEEGVKIIKDLT